MRARIRILYSLLWLALAISGMGVSSLKAAEFGEVQVVSYIGQPLVVEVELTALSNDEISALQVKPSGPDVFRGANIKMNPVLSSMHWVIRHRDKHQFLRITTDKPVQTPFLNMFFELGTKSERSVRALTVWLEPNPQSNQTEVAEPEPPLPVVPMQTTQQASSMQANIPAHLPRPEPDVAAPLKHGRDCHGVQQRCVAIDRENQAIRSQIRALEKDVIELNQTILGPGLSAKPGKSGRVSSQARAESVPVAIPESSPENAAASAPSDSELFLKKEEDTLLPAKKPAPKTLPWKLIALGAGLGLVLLALAALWYRKRRARMKKAPGSDVVDVADVAQAGEAASAVADNLKGWRKWRQAMILRWQALRKPKAAADTQAKPTIKARMSAFWAKLRKKPEPEPVLDAE